MQAAAPSLAVEERFPIRAHEQQNKELDLGN
jgi:hypothetical protein